jgi:hypothetical protein
MHRSRAIIWRAPQFLYKKKTLLWYTHVTVFFFAVIVALFLLKVWGGVIAVSLLFWFFLAKSEEKPKVVEYRVDKQGIMIDGHLFPFSEIHSFILDTSQGVPIITLDLNYAFALPVTMIVKKQHVDEVIELLLQHLPMRTNFSFTRWLTHWLRY